MYVFAKATYDQMRTPYLDQLVPASNTISRRNVEKLLTSRVYDYALNSNVTWRLTDANRAKMYVSANRMQFQREIMKWDKYYID